MSTIKFGNLRLKDFGPYQDANLPLEDQGAVLLVGDNRDTTSAVSNGSGKSHIIKALCWVLFGETLEGDKTDGVIRQGTKSALVSLEFKDGAKRYLLTRTRSRTSGALTLMEDGTPITSATMKDTQAKVNDLLGMDFHTFTNTVVYGEGDSGRFADPDTDDADRKAVIKRIMRITVVDRAQKYVRDKRASVERDLLKAQLNLPVIRAHMAGVDLKTRRATLAQLKSRTAVSTRALARRPKLERLQADVTTLLAEYAAKRADIEAERLVASAADADARALSNRAESLRREAARLETDAAGYAGGCPTCGAPATGKHVQARVHSLAAEQARLLSSAKEVDSEASTKRVTAQAARDKAEALEAVVADEPAWRERLGGLRAELAALDEQQRAMETLAADTRAAQGALASDMVKLKKLQGQKAATEAEVARLDAELTHLDFWIKGFGNQGMPSYMMDEIVPELTVLTNNHLALLSDGDMQVMFDTESALKSGEVRDRFGVTYTIEGLTGVRPSKGQRRKATISAGLALMDLVAKRERSAIDFLALDETFDGLDAAGRGRVVELLNELRKTRSTILVTTHDPGMAELFEKVVKVVKEGGVARLEV